MAKKEIIQQVFNSGNSDKPLADAMRHRAEAKTEAKADAALVEMKAENVGAAVRKIVDLKTGTEQHPDTFVFPDVVVAELVKNKKDPEAVKNKLAQYANEISSLFIEGKKQSSDINVDEVVAAFCNSNKGLKALGKIYTKFVQGKLGKEPEKSNSPEPVATEVPPIVELGGSNEKVIVPTKKNKPQSPVDNNKESARNAHFDSCVSEMLARIITQKKINLSSEDIQSLAAEYVSGAGAPVREDFRKHNIRKSRLQEAVRKALEELLLEKGHIEKIKPVDASAEELKTALELLGLLEKSRITHMSADEEPKKINLSGGYIDEGHDNTAVNFRLLNKKDNASLFDAQAQANARIAAAWREKLPKTEGGTKKEEKTEDEATPKIKKTEAEFGADLQALENTRGALIAYLRKNARVQSAKDGTYNINPSRIAAVLNGTIPVYEIKIPALREKVLAILAQEKGADGGESQKFSKTKEFIDTNFTRRYAALLETQKKIQGAKGKQGALLEIKKTFKLKNFAIAAKEVHLSQLSEADKSKLTEYLAAANQKTETTFREVQSELNDLLKAAAMSQAERTNNNIDQQLEQSFRKNLTDQSIEFINRALGGDQITWGEGDAKESLKKILTESWAEVLASSQYKEKANEIIKGTMGQVDYLFGVKRTVATSDAEKISPAEAQAEFIKNLKEKLGLNPTADNTSAAGAAEDPYQELTPAEERAEEIKDLITEGQGFLTDLQGAPDWVALQEDEKAILGRALLRVHLKKIYKMLETIKNESDGFIEELMMKIITKQI